jgi:hypothetical protein
MGTASALRTYTEDRIFFALNDITHSADSIVSLVEKWNNAPNSFKKIDIEKQIAEMLQNPYRRIDQATGEIKLDFDPQAQSTLNKALKLIFGSTTLPPVINRELKRFKLTKAQEATLPPRVRPTQAQINAEIARVNAILNPPSASATTSGSSGATTPATPPVSSPATPSTPSVLKATAPAFVPPSAPSLMSFVKTKPPPKKPAGKGLKVGYSAEATGGLGHIYPISHNLILRMCEHLV